MCDGSFDSYFLAGVEIPVMMSKPDSEIGQSYTSIAEQLLAKLDSSEGKKEGPAISME